MSTRQSIRNIGTSAPQAGRGKVDTLLSDIVEKCFLGNCRKRERTGTGADPFHSSLIQMHPSRSEPWHQQVVPFDARVTTTIELPLEAVSVWHAAGRRGLLDKREEFAASPAVLGG
jgi:hypothetical protein